MEKQLHLVAGPGPAPLAPLDASGQRVQAAVADGGPVAVAGAPGTGKTNLALVLTVEALAQDKQVVLVSPTRSTAGWLRQAVEQAAGSVEGPVAMTPVAFALRLLELRAQAIAASGLPGAAALAAAEMPEMVTGAQQDAAIASLLEGYRSGQVPAVAWPNTVPDAALSLAAFRAELRDLMMRAAERGLGPDQLAGLGQRHDRPEWVAAAGLYQDYLDVFGLRSSGDAGLALDAAAMVAAAARALEVWDQPIEPPGGGPSLSLPEAAKPRFDLVVVDDYQEAGSALAHLVRLMAKDGAQIVLLGCPDLAVQGYRGALPELLAEACDEPPAGLGAHLEVLQTCHRQSGPLLRATGRICQAIRPGRLGLATRRALEPTDPASQSGSSSQDQLTTEPQSEAES
ncbi:MAG: UvrD-helicase domain-containing protein, partial [Micrococcales bacterium]|nr:UvrD-helicase domain-containing protein [Micrococcales bacterium]